MNIGCPMPLAVLECGSYLGASCERMLTKVCADAEAHSNDAANATDKSLIILPPLFWEDVIRNSLDVRASLPTRHNPSPRAERSEVESARERDRGACPSAERPF